MFKFHNLYKLAVMRDNGEGGGGGGGVEKPAHKPAETFSREYVHELREENKATRLKLQEEATARKAAEEKAASAEKAAQENITTETAAATQRANERIIRTELKVVALKEGLVDLDDLKLLDVSGIEVDDDGNIKGAEDIIKKFKEDKPHKFGEASTSHNVKPPKKDDLGDPKKVKDMTPEERKAEARKLGISIR